MLSRRLFLASVGATSLGVGAFVLSNAFAGRAAQAQVMTPAEAQRAAASGEILLVDIRRPDEWRLTGVARGAVTIDMRSSDFIEQIQAARQNNEQPIAVICARGVRSARVTKWLEDAALAPIIDIPEGMLGSRAGPGWIERRLPLRKVE